MLKGIMDTKRSGFVKNEWSVKRSGFMLKGVMDAKRSGFVKTSGLCEK